MEIKMKNPQVVSPSEWHAARLELLEREKDFTRERDALSAARREMPWEKVEKEYLFDTDKGQKTLADLFAGRSQLLIYHFMLGEDWKTGCKSCSFWADNFDGIDVHLANRDVTFLAISRASLDKIATFKQRMGWSFDWISSAPSQFNRDYNVSFDKANFETGKPQYNYRDLPYEMDEHAGVSVFARNNEDEVFHTYSTFSRGLDILNGAYNYLDLTPKGRDEGELEHPMSWLRHHDAY